MRDGSLEHPDITSALRTGYPLGMGRERICPRCGESMGALAYTVSGEQMCEDCFGDYVTERLNTEPDKLALDLGCDVEWIIC